MAIANTITDAGTPTGGFTFEVQESNTTAAADATAVADNELLGSEADLQVVSDSAGDSIIGGIGYLGTKRYVRLVATGTTRTAIRAPNCHWVALHVEAASAYVCICNGTTAAIKEPLPREGRRRR